MQFWLLWPLVSQQPSAVMTALGQLPRVARGNSFIPFLQGCKDYQALAWCTDMHPSPHCKNYSSATLEFPVLLPKCCDTQHGYVPWAKCQGSAASEVTCHLELACIFHPCSTTHSRPLYMRRPQVWHVKMSTAELRLIGIPTEMCRRIMGAARAQCVTYLAKVLWYPAWICPVSEAASEATCHLELACILNPCSTTHFRPLYMRRHKWTLTPFSFAVPLCTYCSHEAVQSSQLSKNRQLGGTLRSSSLPLGDSTIFLPFFSVGKYLDTESSNMPDSLRNWLLFNHCCHSRWSTAFSYVMCGLSSNAEGDSLQPFVLLSLQQRVRFL